MKLLQPRAFDAFRCIGADCEDTCCDGWGIVIDQETYGKYQRLGDPRLTGHIAVNENAQTGDHFAKIKLAGTTCPFLDGGLCSIQNTLGEDLLSKTCRTYPRINSVIDGVLQRTLDLSCPEAARLILLNEDPLEFVEQSGEEDLSRVANVSTFDSNADSDKPCEHFWDIRGQIVEALQDRSESIEERLRIVARMCDLEDVEAGPELSPVARLETVLELIVTRIGSDFTNRRFLECYEEFILGMEWTSSTTMDQLMARFEAADRDFYRPFFELQEYMLEHYLVNYVHKALFPFGPQRSSHEIGGRLSERSIRAHCMLLVAYFAMIKTVATGMAAYHQERLSPAHAVKLIQTFTRAFEHSLKYPDQVAGILAAKGLRTASSVAQLI